MRVLTRRTLCQPPYIQSRLHFFIWSRGCSSFHSNPRVSLMHSAARRLETHSSVNRPYSKDRSDDLSTPTGGIVTTDNELGMPQMEESQEKAPARKRKGGMAGLRGLTRKSTPGEVRASKSEESPSSVRRILGQDPSHPIRARFAPSPTGNLHLGSLRTALFNKLAATATKGGQFILRIEDTDQRRKVEGAEEKVMEDLKWAGLDWQEGPDIGGPYGPYRQSERLPIYRDHVNKLLEKGHAYRCFCTTEQLEKTKLEQHAAGQPTVYSGTCRSVSKDEGEERAAKGEAHVIRFKADDFPRPGFVDQIYGRFKKNEDEDDFILIKQDGFPTYHFANVVDDHLMHITHVIRGEEWLVSTPKHIALYEAFGWKPPQFAHLGLLININGTKLSKRDSANSIHDLGSGMALAPISLNTWLATLGSSIDEKKTTPRSLQELSDRLTFKFTRGGIRVDHNKRSHFEKKYWQRLRTVMDAQVQSGQPVAESTAASEIGPGPAQCRSPELVQALPEDALSAQEMSILENSVYRQMLRFMATLRSRTLSETFVPPLHIRAPSSLWAGWIDPASCFEKDYEKLPSHITACLNQLFQCRPPQAKAKDWFEENWYIFLRPTDISYGQGLNKIFAQKGQTVDAVAEIHEYLDFISNMVQNHEHASTTASSRTPLFWEVSRLIVRGEWAKPTPSLAHCIKMLGEEEMCWRIERVRALLRAGEETFDFPKAQDNDD